MTIIEAWEDFEKEVLLRKGTVEEKTAFAAGAIIGAVCVEVNGIFKTGLELVVIMKELRGGEGGEGKGERQ